MKDENKCFFSISLENGITITGKNPIEVRTFLQDCYTAIGESITLSEEQGFKIYAEKQRQLYIQMVEASVTIKKNLIKQEN